MCMYVSVRACMRACVRYLFDETERRERENERAKGRESEIAK